MSSVREFLADLLAARVDRASIDWLERSASDIASGASHARFTALISTASRHSPRRALAPSSHEIAQAFDLVEGWNPERWTVLECARVLLVLSRPDLARNSAVEAIEEAFRYADVGEMCALHRSLVLLPEPARFVWRAGEGCRSSMRAVFEAAACDTPFPVKNFDDLAWRQLVIKALFVEAPLWRVYGLDTRLDPELARMALDLAEERRAAGRNVQHELWLTLGRVGGERALASIDRELAGTSRVGRSAAAIALARAGQMARLVALCERERDPAVADVMRSALKGRIHSTAFRDLDPALGAGNGTPA
jgi:hypothetical protein